MSCSNIFVSSHLKLGASSDFEKLHDMVKYLDLELHFGQQKNSGEHFHLIITHVLHVTFVTCDCAKFVC